MSSYITLLSTSTSSSTSTLNMSRNYCSTTTSGTENLRRGDDDGRDSGYGN